MPEEGKTPILNNVGAGINATIQDGELTAFGFDAKGSFTFHGLTVSILGGSGQGFSFQYDFEQKQFELGGGLQLQFNGDTLIADFGSQTAPGIIIKDSQAQTLDASIIITMQRTKRLPAYHLLPPAPTACRSIYDQDMDEFEITGGLQLYDPGELQARPSGSTWSTKTAAGFDHSRQEAHEARHGRDGQLKYLRPQSGRTRLPALIGIPQGKQYLRPEQRSASPISTSSNRP